MTAWLVCKKIKLHSERTVNVLGVWSLCFFCALAAEVDIVHRSSFFLSSCENSDIYLSWWRDFYWEEQVVVIMKSFEEHYIGFYAE